MNQDFIMIVILERRPNVSIWDPFCDWKSSFHRMVGCFDDTRFIDCNFCIYNNFYCHPSNR